MQTGFYDLWIRFLGGFSLTNEYFFWWFGAPYASLKDVVCIRNGLRYEYDFCHLNWLIYLLTHCVHLEMALDTNIVCIRNDLRYKHVFFFTNLQRCAYQPNLYFTNMWYMCCLSPVCLKGRVFLSKFAFWLNPVDCKSYLSMEPKP